MGDVRRYDMRCVGGGDMAEAVAVEDSDGVYVEHYDYARLEREYAGLCDRYDKLTDALGAQCAESTRLERERDMYKAAVEIGDLEASQAELTRLRAVEAAAMVLLDGACEIEIGRNTITEVGPADLRSLAEACGRKA